MNHPDTKLNNAHTRGPNFTWRGISSQSAYGMRIDHCICSQPLLPLIQSVTILGNDRDRSSFLDSDHCPLIVIMQPTANVSNDSAHGAETRCALVCARLRPAVALCGNAVCSIE